MILLWGIMEDTPMNMAFAELSALGANFFFLDHRKIFESEIEYTFNSEEGAKSIIRVDGRELDLDDVMVAYLRPYSFRDYSQMEGKALDDPMAVRASGFEAQLTAWLDASDALVLNKSEPSASNNSKPYQLSLISKAGFKVPQTYISNDKECVKSFLTESGDVVYKSISGVRSIVHKISDRHIEFIDDVQWCPTLFQKVIDGINYRAHVFDNQIFAVRIESDRLDYRYGNTKMTAEDLPYDVAQKCHLINEMLGLHFSGIDLMRTDDDEWYCFEVNPSPGYSYFELNGGQPISAMLARFLMDSDR
jgi:hypothetical protein